MDKIKITFPDGHSREYDKAISAYKIAESISPRLAEDALAVEVDSVVKDLNTPVKKDSAVKFLTFEDDKGKHVYWHSTSHLMAHAVQSIYPEAKFGVGPAIESGFYYDIDINSSITEDDLKKIEIRMLKLSKENNVFVREELTKENALEFFNQKGDNYKTEIISEINETVVAISVYKEGHFTDLCIGSHIPSTNKIKFVKLLSISGSYWRGNEKNKQIQRIYGVSFPKKKMLEDYLAFLEEAKIRDHRRLGKELELFMFSQKIGAGLPVWLPKGTVLRET